MAARGTAAKTSGRTKKSRNRRASSPRWTRWTTWLLMELCIVAVFGTIVFAVFQSVEKKRQRYLITELVYEKLRLEDALGQEQLRVEELSSLERITSLITEHGLDLAPAAQPALLLGPSKEVSP